MPLTIPQFINYWNKQISDWAALGGKITPDESYWLPYANKLSLQQDFIPEPYYGDPNKCSMVILNFNPGHGVPTQHISNANNTNTICWRFLNPKYSATALTFPILGQYNSANPFHNNTKKNPLYYAGRPWWLNKEKWVKHLFDSVGIQYVNPPFALEHCGWHSKNWRGLSYADPTLRAKIIDLLGDVLPKAILNSDITTGVTKSKVGICMGSPFGDFILPMLGFTQIPMPAALNQYLAQGVNNGSDKTFYYSASGNQIRGYRLYRHESGALMINTWARGGNGSPSIHNFGNFNTQLIQSL